MTIRSMCGRCCPRVSRRQCGSSYSRSARLMANGLVSTRSCRRMTRLDERALTFRPLTPGDLRLLHAWVQRPHVAQWWAEPRTLEDIERDYLPVANGASSTHAYIVLLDDAPV